MAIKGGSLTEVRINGRNYDPTNESSPTFFLASTMQENEITANRNIHSIKKQAMNGFEGLELSVTDADFAVLAGVWDAGIEVEVTITRATGVTYGGLCMPDGECQLDNAGKVTIAMKSGSFKQIS
ncbi:hypothetical protein PVA45_07240 (plasmid) [Entomospira entomophila]|uniref:Phage tail protein n=1 Tax=Entomospira entomophila TaxID=2719988 RepID=A0A968GB86_9SPIO|nr:hypothetical protein [Entomospira entomophilus]NIZ41347.1 hypothetical protein [Entomospira entomophilus]WDI36242.1 hypothetical protein PVA45_07240 [Entomospira entomophilus]